MTGRQLVVHPAIRCALLYACYKRATKGGGDKERGPRRLPTRGWLSTTLLDIELNL